MLFALVQAGENVVLEDIAADFRRVNPGAGLICMESKEQAAQLKALLEEKSLDASVCNYKVANGPRPKHGSVAPLLRGCGEEWPALFCGRASDTEGIMVYGAFVTPWSETLYIVRIHFFSQVAGSDECGMAVLHRKNEAGKHILPRCSWTELAKICRSQRVRIIGGHLPKLGKHPLITELEKIIPTTTILAKRTDPHPYCVLGGIQTTVATCQSVPFCVKKGAQADTMDFNGLVSFPMLTVKDPKTSVANTTKCLLLVKGSNATLPAPWRIIPYDRRDDALFGAVDYLYTRRPCLRSIQHSGN